MENKAVAEVTGLRTFKCHKVVMAGQILEIRELQRGMDLRLEGTVTRRVTRVWARRHKPAVGGYLVVYSDGYESYSPAKAFEEGYTPIESKEAAVGPSDTEILDWLEKNPDKLLCERLVQVASYEPKFRYRHRVERTVALAPNEVKDRLAEWSMPYRGLRECVAQVIGGGKPRESATEANARSGSDRI